MFAYTHPSSTEIYSLSLHDALPISIAAYSIPTYLLVLILVWGSRRRPRMLAYAFCIGLLASLVSLLLLYIDRKSTRLNSSHRCISYAVFCLKKKNIY